jgi:hypothetical protein
MFHLILITLLLLQAISSVEAFVAIPKPSRPRTILSTAQGRITKTALSLTRSPSIYPSSHGISAALALSPPLLISLGPLQYSWYEDTGTAGFGRRVVYSESEDEEELFWLEDATYAHSRKVKQHPFDDDNDILYFFPQMGSTTSTTTEPKSRLRRGIAKIRRWLHRKISR